MDIKLNMRSRKKILVVEDNSQLRNALVIKLRSLDYNVVQAPNGEDGLGLALSEQPDLLILDLLMPRMGGHEMLRLLHKNEMGKHIPAIILTNDGSRESVDEALLNGAPAYFSKSGTSLKELVEIVSYHLGG